MDELYLNVGVISVGVGVTINLSQGKVLGVGARKGVSWRKVDT